MFFTVQKTAHDWQFKADSKNGCHTYKSGCLWPRGKMLGGTSGINAMIYLRSHRRDYNGWHELGNPGWSYDDVLKYFKKSEQNLNENIARNGKYHSENGLLKVGFYRDNETYNTIENCHISAAKETGYEYVHDFNSEELLGYSRVQGTIHNGRRQSAAKAFLIPAKDRSNLHIIKHAHVTKIDIDNDGRASAVNFIYNGANELTVKTQKEVIVSGGAISSPQLLMLSGIGPKNHLQKFNIEVKKNLAVGENLQDHLNVPMFFSFHRSKAETLKSDDILSDTIDLLLNNKGSFSILGITDLVGYINTVNGTGYPDIELHFFDFKVQSIGLKTYLDTVGYGDDIQKKLIEENQDSELSMVFVVLLNPKSKGRIQLKSSDPFEKPSIFANYLDEDEDWNTILNGVKFQYNHTNSKAFKEHEGSFIKLPIGGCEKFEYLSDEYFKCYINAMATTVYHPVGTVKMGPTSRKDSVVDSRLRVHGIPNLRVIDASIMPTIVSSNTNAPAIMIGERGSDFIKEDWNVARDEL